MINTVKVIVANILGWSISLAEFETAVRIGSIVLASIYTGIKIYQALKKRTE